MEEFQHWQALAEKASRNAKAASKAAIKWKVMMEAFNDELDEAPAVEGVARTPVATRAEKAARTLQTSAIATRK
jgi:hypothetical protein